MNSADLRAMPFSERRDLARRARSKFPATMPHHRHNRRAWIRSIAYLRSRKLWVLEGGPALFHASR